MTYSKLILGGAFCALSAGAAMAAPVIQTYTSTADHPLVQQVRNWRYNERCGWGGGHWTVDLGEGRVVACRPVRPHGAWRWHREGEREGWYDNRRRAWHYDKW